MKIVWTTQALKHLEAIVDYIAKENPAAAARTIDRIREASHLLVAHPLVGRPGRIEDMRELVVMRTPYILAYRVGETEVEVLAVFHSARKWPEAF